MLRVMTSVQSVAGWCSRARNVRCASLRWKSKAFTLGRARNAAYIKRIYDKFGHSVGDNVLTRLSAFLSLCPLARAADIRGRLLHHAGEAMYAAGGSCVSCRKSL